MASHSMSFVDCEAVFVGRLRDLGLRQTVIDDMKNRGWKTLSTVAFSTRYGLLGKSSQVVLMHLQEDHVHLDAGLASNVEHKV